MKQAIDDLVSLVRTKSGDDVARRVEALGNLVDLLQSEFMLERTYSLPTVGGGSIKVTMPPHKSMTAEDWRRLQAFAALGSGEFDADDAKPAPQASRADGGER